METDLQDGGDQALTPVRQKTILCALDEIDDPGAKGFEPDGGAPFFVVRKGRRVFGYINSCPHYGSTLEWKDDTFLTHDKELIQCSLHAALFRIEDGCCIDGPCTGAGLKPLAVRVEAGNIVLAD